MTGEVRDRMFEPFFTTKEIGPRHRPRPVDGARRSSGRAAATSSVESEPGAGHDVQGLLSAPGATLGRADAGAVAPRHGAPCKGEGVVLLAEDDRSVRRLVVTELTRRGFTVLEAEDGGAALEMFRKREGSHRRARHRRRDAAHERRRSREGGRADSAGLEDPVHLRPSRSAPAPASIPTGVTNLLMKPFTADTLAARIKELIDRKDRGRWLNAPETPRAPPRARQVGPDRDRRQPGDRQRDLPAAAQVARAGRPVGAARVSRRRPAVAVDRAVLRGGRQPLRIDRRTVSCRRAPRSAASSASKSAG